MKLFYVRMHGNRPPMVLFGHTRALVGRTIKKMLGVDAVDEVIPISRQDAEAEFGRNYELMARQNMIRNETVSVLSGDNPFLREKMDIKKADMGDVVDDFKKSDAPQFQGKSMAKRRQMAVAAKLNSEGAMKRIATQDAEKERLGPRKVKGSGMDTFKKKDIKLSEATDPKMIKTLKAMIKDGDEQSVRLLIQGLPKNMKKDVMKKLGLKEDIDVRAVARNEIVERLNKAKITEAEKATKDMNGDGKIDAKDLKIQNLEKDLKIRNLEADIEAADTPETPAPMIPQKMRVMDKGDSWDCVDEKGDCSKSFPYDNKKTTSKSARHDANRYAEKAYDEAIKGAMKDEAAPKPIQKSDHTHTVHIDGEGSYKVKAKSMDHAKKVAFKQAGINAPKTLEPKTRIVGEDQVEEKTADEQEAEGGGHIVMQLRKSVSMRGQKDVKFNDGSTHKVSAAHADKFLSKHASLKTSHEKRALQNQAAKSHNHLQKSISEEGLSERTPVKATVQDPKLKNLRVPNPNYKNKEYVRPKKKDNERSMEVYREEEEVVSENYTSAEFYADYLSIAVKK